MKVAFNNLILNGLKDSTRYQFVYETIKKTSTNYVNTLTSLNFSSDKNHQNGKLLVLQVETPNVSNLDFQSRLPFWFFITTIEIEQKIFDNQSTPSNRLNQNRKRPTTRSSSNSHQPKSRRHHRQPRCASRYPLDSQSRRIVKRLSTN